MTIVNLFFLTPNKFGGTITFTAHLYHALKLAGANVNLFKIGKKSNWERFIDFGYGCELRTITIEDANALKGHRLITCAIGDEYEAPVRAMLAKGAWLVVHDPNDVQYYEDRAFLQGERLFIIRPNNTSICPNATFIPHPFVRHKFAKRLPHAQRPLRAVTLSRLGAIKKTPWVLLANRQLQPRDQIKLRGYDDRFYTFNNLIRNGKFEEFVQDSKRPEGDKLGFPKVMGAAQEIASQAVYLVDLTVIKNDGGGTQYTFLEAIDSGCAMILNKEWIRPDGLWHPGRNCLAVGSADELVAAVKDRKVNTEHFAAECAKIMSNHDPITIGKRYLTTLDGYIKY